MAEYSEQDPKETYPDASFMSKSKASTRYPLACTCVVKKRKKSGHDEFEYKLIYIFRDARVCLRDSALTVVKLAAIMD